MAKNYSYPRVTMSTLAKKHSHNVVNVPDTTIMFAPLVTEKGPDDRVVKVHTLSEFIEIFGSFNEEFYNLNGQMALNVYNWLSNGGTLMVKRLIGGAATATFESTTTNPTVNYTPKFLSTGKSFVKNNVLIVDIGNENYFVLNENEMNAPSKTQTFGSGENAVSKTFKELVIAVDVVGTANIENYIFTIVDDYGGYDIIPIPTGNAGYSFESLTVDQNNCETLLTTKGIGFKKTSDGNVYYNFKSGDGDNKKTINDFKPIFRFSRTTVGAGQISFKAKYAGSYYNNIQLVAEQITPGTLDEEGKVNADRYFNFYVQYIDEFSKKITLEKFLQKNIKNYAAALSSSEYIEENLDAGATGLKVLFTEESLSESSFNGHSNYVDNGNNKHSYTFRLSSGTKTITKYTGSSEGDASTTISNIISYWTNYAEKDIINRLETPIDIIFDAGYPITIKRQILNFVNNSSETAIRPDIVYIMDDKILGGLRLERVEDEYAHLNNDMWSSEKPTNVAIYTQHFTILDSVFTSQQIYVTPTYFLSKLIAYNDLTYGLQYPTAGLRRGILDDALWVDENPSPDQKEAWFQKRVNYVEKSAREYAFMSQRTFDGSSDMDYTALSFLNNERVLERMKKDLETIGRSYLHEFNDAITIANMSNALNKYVSNWISNRTLSMGVVEVVQDEVSENALDINLNIRFTNTIEVINVSIVIE